jgi:hypothetical protein
MTANLYAGEVDALLGSNRCDECGHLDVLHVWDEKYDVSRCEVDGCNCGHCARCGYQEPNHGRANRSCDQFVEVVPDPSPRQRYERVDE